MKGKTRTLLTLLLVITLLAVMVPSVVLAEGKRAYFTGQWCVLDNPPGTPPATEKPLPNGRSLYHEFTFNNDVTTDPRISGTDKLEFWWLYDTNSYSGRTWATIEMTNAAGGWSGFLVGSSEVKDIGLVFTFHGFVVGKGAYKGLVAYLESEGVPGYDIGGPGCYFTLNGYIEKIGAGRH
jgi:hypothetical protein